MTKIYLMALSAGLCVFACSAPDDQPKDWVRPTSQAVSGDATLSEVGIQCTVSTYEQQVHVRLTNLSSEDFRILPWGTPWDEKYDSLDLHTDAEQARYLGVRALRGDPDSEDYFDLARGGSIETVVDADSRYAAETETVFRARLSNSFFRGMLGDEPIVLQQDCGEGIVRLPASKSRGTSRVIAEPLVANSGCNASQTEQINAVLPATLSATRAAREAASNQDSVYTMWFGDAPEAYPQTMLYSIYYDVWPNFSVRCGGDDCCDDDDVVACTTYEGFLGTGHDRIYVCSPWYSKPTLSVEANSSQVGTLVHEMSHQGAGVPPLGNTDDRGYGADGARDLASSNWLAAVDNGENYEHFASHAYLLRFLPALL